MKKLARRLVLETEICHNLEKMVASSTTELFTAAQQKNRYLKLSVKKRSDFYFTKEAS